MLQSKVLHFAQTAPSDSSIRQTPQDLIASIPALIETRHHVESTSA
jgi:hypothetical protein